MKSKWVALLLAAGMAIGMSGCGQTPAQPENVVTVQAVSMLVSTGSVGLMDKVAGKIVSGQTAQVNKDSTKTILDVLVSEGDWVEAGDLLFSYDTKVMELDLGKLQLELQALDSAIISAQEQIAELTRQQKYAGASQQLSYTLQIQTQEANLREAEYNKVLKQREIEAMEASMANTEVTAPIAGRVMSINEDSSGTDPNQGYPGETGAPAFITLMDTATYRVQGNLNELSLGALTEGMPVIIRSRLDESRTWAGVVELIDWSNPVADENNGGGAVYYGPKDEMTTTSKYAFYVSLSDMTGLMLGQHVYIEPDYGQDNAKEGLWLPGYFLSDTDTAAWVWAASSRDKLEKRSVQLGTYDAEMDEYQILSGLTEEDYIAFPEEGLTEGLPVSRISEGDFGSGQGDSMGDGGKAGSAVAEPMPGGKVG